MNFFQPKFYTGGPARFYLPLLHDLIAQEKPRLVVTQGLGDGQAHLSFCQTVAEENLATRCCAIRRAGQEKKEMDAGWTRAREATEKFFSPISQLLEGDAADGFADDSIDLLLIDDVDEGQIIRQELATWRAKLAPQAIILFHGVDLERSDSLQSAWRQFTKKKTTADFSDGIGLSAATSPAAAEITEFRRLLFGKSASLRQHYRVAAELIEKRAELKENRQRLGVLQTRQLWFDTLLEDRSKAQEVMDHQVRLLDDLQRKSDALHLDRSKAQTIIEHQDRRIAEVEPQLKAVLADRLEAQRILDYRAQQIADIESQFAAVVADRTKAQTVMESLTASLEQSQARLIQTERQVSELKQIIKFAKAACGKKGRCFVLPKEPKIRRSVPQRVLREIQRTPGNLRRKFRPNPAPPLADSPASIPPAIERKYAAWIAEHENFDLAAQREISASWRNAPTISLLIPTFETSTGFLDDLFSSLLAQSYEKWQACVVDGGSGAATTAALTRWMKRDARIQVQRLTTNLGVAGNTNRALQNAQGEFVALVDHDDQLAPFALFFLAESIRQNPGAEIFYSDEDRLSEEGVRANPFFKPEWSPALLYSCMYLGHLTACQADLVRALGGLRSEFDLSQDYDLALRATERAQKIVHIPHVLYHWREHPASGASGGKPAARQTNIAALASAVQRRGLDAEVLEYPTANRVRMRLKNRPVVSVVIPSDSALRVEKCGRELPAQSDYSAVEYILVTNSSLVRNDASASGRVRFVAFDRPFNFSAKCNAGARASKGDRLIFLNDDVETTQRDWIENLIEPLENPEIGATAPKLIYPTGRIQHAGLVTGVRDFPGTAFHQQSADSVIQANFAQSMRDVSALSGACLAIRREDFFAVGGFDEVNVPIAHSDVDLCFKIRAAGKRCVYTPFTTMNHVGHASIGASEIIVSAPRDKSTAFLLQRWGAFTTHDPFFPDNMRDWLFADSPTSIRMFAQNNPSWSGSKLDLLLVSHDLTFSGAPLLLLHLAKWCMTNGYFVTMIAPADGPLRKKIVDAGIPLIIDSLIATGHESFGRLMRHFDVVVANTVRTPSAITTARREGVPVAWYMHETDVGEYYLARDMRVRAALPLANLLLAASERSLSIFRPFVTCPVFRLKTGCPDVVLEVKETPISDGTVRFVILGTLERRKGQDVLLEAVRLLKPSFATRSIFEVVGSGLDEEFIAKLRETARSLANVRLHPQVDHHAALRWAARSDVVVCASRDESMPLAILEAMSLGKTIISTAVGGIPDYLTDNVTALLVAPENATELARAIERVIVHRAEALQLGKNARAMFADDLMLDRYGRDFVELISTLAPAVASNRAEKGASPRECVN